jgi:excinuclease ABC subunit A
MATNPEYLTCIGLRTHNLKNINLKIPLKKWVAITGVSGSGKSSLAFDTIYSESQRRFLETLGTYERQFLQGLPQGEFDEINNIPAAIALKQSNRTGDPRSVIATASDVAEPLRTLFISLMEPSCTACGSPVIISPPSDLILFLCNMERKMSRDSYLISVPFLLQNQKITEDLIIEGYSRICIENEIISLEDLAINSKKQIFPIQVQIVLDRINCSLENTEIANRVETIWSQVKFSPRFSYINVFKLENSKKISNENFNFHVQAFCQKCNQQTHIIQSNDLDWQSVLGSCKSCNGLGNIPVLDENKIIPNPNLSLASGAIKPWTSESFSWMNEELIRACKKRGIKTTEPYTNLNNEAREWIWNGDNNNNNTKSSKYEYVTIKEFFNILEQEKYKSTSRILLAKYRKYILCPECEGARVGKSGKNAICFGRTYHEIFQSEIKETLYWLEQIKKERKFEKKLIAISEVYHEAIKKISLLNQLGLGSAHLFRRCKTLSGGEYQRVLLTRVIGNGLTDALYVLDEPSVGLGKNEIPTLISCIQELRDLGNTILMVEHDKDLILASDEIFELGPGGGEEGGELLVIQNGTPSSFISKYSMLDKKQIKEKVTQDKIFKNEESIYINQFSALNCKNLDFEIILGKLNVISGPSGAGKSTLIRFGLEAALDKLKEYKVTNNTDLDYDSKIGTWKNILIPNNFFQTTDIVSVEQKALHRTATSVPATILGLMDILRKNFAATKESKLSGFNLSDFSFNGAGSCEFCSGKGTIQEDLFFLGEVEKICPDCNGTRYRNEVLDIKWNGKNIYEWLSTSLNECKLKLGKQVGFGKAISLCCQLGLGHIPLGMATTSMSGGEAQRLRICAALAKSTKKIFCILDEPTRGLSEKDVGNLLDSLLRLSNEGHTFVIVEHHELFQTQAHHLIKLGPGSGAQGGKIVERILTVAK